MSEQSQQQYQQQQQSESKEQSQELHQIQKKVLEMDNKLDKVLSIITGNELDIETGGMVKRVNAHEKRITRIEKVIDRGFYFLIGLSAFAGWGIVDIIQKIFIKS